MTLELRKYTFLYFTEISEYYIIMSKQAEIVCKKFVPNILLLSYRFNKIAYTFPLKVSCALMRFNNNTLKLN